VTGTCQISACTSVGQSCTTSSQCCTSLFCIDQSTGSPCGAMGSCTCQPIIQ
jgi:hypothetical protein